MAQGLVSRAGKASGRPKGGAADLRTRRLGELSKFWTW